MSFSDGYWTSADELRLHYRDYAPPGDAGDRPVVICLPGLTRNARDFEGVAARLQPKYRVLCVDFRGRGGSAAAPDPMTYMPLQYCQDVMALIATLELKRVVLIGTSLGGLVSMLLAASYAAMGLPSPIVGVLLNDVGPVIETSGLDRIKGYVGKAVSWPTWVHAARALAELHGSVYPAYKLDDWLRMAKQLNRLTASGRIVPDYDKQIAEPLRQPGGEAGVDLWPAFNAFGDIPVMVVRGGTSDILKARTVTQMVKALPNVEAVTVPKIGHAPTLEEPEAAKAIDALLKRATAR